MPMSKADLNRRLYTAAFKTAAMMCLMDYIIYKKPRNAASSLLTTGLVLAFIAVVTKLSEENKALLRNYLPDQLMAMVDNLNQVNIREWLKEAIAYGDVDPRYPLIIVTACGCEVVGEGMRRTMSIPLPPTQTVSEFAQSLFMGLVLVSVGQKFTGYPGALLGKLADLIEEQPRQTR